MNGRLAPTRRAAVAFCSILAVTLPLDMPAAAAPADAPSASAGARVDAKPIHELEAAAQRLRDAIHVMAQAAAGQKRTAAIRDANVALARTQAAMANLPPELLLAGGREGDYAHAMDRLEQAAQDLRDASHALATEPSSERRNAAMERIDKALLDTQQTMLDAYTASSR